MISKVCRHPFIKGGNSDFRTLRIQEVNLELVCGRRKWMNSLLVMENWSRKEIGTHLYMHVRNGVLLN